jgi:hypothetical protein
MRVTKSAGLSRSSSSSSSNCRAFGFDRNEVAAAAAFGEHLRTPAPVLVDVKVQQFGNAESRSEKHRDRGVVAQSLVGAAARPHAHHLRRGEQAEFVGAGSGCCFSSEWYCTLPLPRYVENRRSEGFACVHESIELS